MNCMAAMHFFRRRDRFRSPLARALAARVRSWQGRLRNSLLNEGVYLCPIDAAKPRARIAADVITEDGHFSRHPSLPVIVGDTYADKRNVLHLYVYALDKGLKVEVASFDHGVTTSDGNLRCDLHPRWNRGGDQLAVDVCERGVRRLRVIDVRDVVRLDNVA